MPCQVENCVCSGERIMAPLEDLQQLERVGTAEVVFTVHAVQIHTALPLPGLVQSADPQITLISLQPRVVLVENFLSDTECQARSWSLKFGSSSSSLLPLFDLACSAPLLLRHWQMLWWLQKAYQVLTAL